MTWTAALATYFIIWWLVLFMVLPWGVNRVNPDDLLPGEDPGSPQKGRLMLKFAVTTVIAGVFFGIFFWVEQSGLVSFRG